MKVCPKCDAFFTEQQKWVLSENESLARKKHKDIEFALCPGCERLEKKRIDGIVYLRGDFLNRHSDEALNLINNVAEKKRRKNIAARIYRMDRDNEGITIETTDKTLAERIGKEFEKAFSGDLDIKWLEDAEFARVNWKRD